MTKAAMSLDGLSDVSDMVGPLFDWYLGLVPRFRHDFG